MSDKKKLAAEKAVELVQDGMKVGLGTGSTAFFAIEAIGRLVKNGYKILAVPTSLASEKQARELGIPLATLEEAGTLDITIDGAITDANGARVLPCEIEAGRRILVLGLDSGAVNARITSVKKKGSYHAVVTVNNAPRELDVYLARLAKREVA